MRFKKQKTIHTLCSQPKSYDELRGLLFADCLVALSEETRRHLQRIGFSQVVQISPGLTIDPDESLGNLDHSHWAKQKKADEIWVLYPGDYEHSEGHGPLLDCLPDLLQENPRIRLIFACRQKTRRAKTLEKKAMQKASRQGTRQAVKFVGEVKDMKSLIRACDFTVFPVHSLYKKMDIPLVLLESLALERPVIVSDLPSLKEFVSDAIGRIVPSRSSEELRNRILELAQNAALRQTLGRNGRAYVKANFDAAIIAKRYEELYRDLSLDDSRTHDTQSYYDRFSRTYENRRQEGYHALLDDLEASIVEPYAKGKTVLEVGCGTGLIMKRLSSHAYEILGIDPSEGMLKKAREKGLKVQPGSLESIPFADNYFDVCYSFKVLAHVPNVERALQEMARVTKKNGYVIVEFYNTFSLRGLRWWIRKHFFYDKGSRERPKETSIYTRYDTFHQMHVFFPPSLEIVEIRGVMIWTPFAVIYKIPILAKGLACLEKKWNRGIWARLAGFVVFVTRKK